MAKLSKKGVPLMTEFDHTPSYGEIVKKRSAFSESFIFDLITSVKVQHKVLEMELRYFTANCIYLGK